MLSQTCYHRYVITDMLSQIRDHTAQWIKVSLLHGQSLNIFIIHFQVFKSVSSKRRKSQSQSKSKCSMPKTQITIGITRNTMIPVVEKNKGFIKGTHILFCALQLIHFMNMNEVCYFFVVIFWSFFSTELNTLSENEPI